MPTVEYVHYTFTIEGVGAALTAARIHGVEALSELYRFDLTLVSEDDAIALEDAVGKEAVLAIIAGPDTRYVHGIVTQFEQQDEGKKSVQYGLTLVPRVKRLEHRKDSRIFQELTVPDIIRQVLEAAGIRGSQFKQNLVGSYKPREYCVQYRESDWAFICRLMEEEGIYYFFEHTQDNHVLVFADATSAHKPIPGDSTLTFRPSLGVVSHGQHVHSFRASEEIVTGKVTLRDWTFKKPELLLEANAQATTDSDLEVYDYPGEYDVLGDAAPLAKIRLEQHQAIRKLAHGGGSCFSFSPGSTFTLAEHPRDSSNRGWLIARVEHTGATATMAEAATGDTTTTYNNRFTCMPDDVPFRAPSRTPRPTIKGIQTAIVVGPNGEEIYTDEHGRVKVQFHWDRQGKRDQKSSCWIRVSQIWAGAAWGSIYIPRIGHEVVVDFLEGDPDRPLIVGRVYHGANVPPYPLPADKTKSTIKSNSSPGGDGYNEFRLEDKKGQEEIFLHGQKDWTIEILHDKAQEIGNDEHLHVGSDRTIVVENDQAVTIKRDVATTIARDATSSVGRDESLKVGGNRDATIAGNQTVTVSGDDDLSVSGKQTQTIGGDVTATITGARTDAITKDHTESVDGDSFLNVKGKREVAIKGTSSFVVDKDSEETVNANKTVTVAESVIIECGDTKITMKKDGTILIEGKDITVKGTGKVLVQGASAVDVRSDGAIKVEASGAVNVKGATVGMN